MQSPIAHTVWVGDDQTNTIEDSSVHVDAFENEGMVRISLNSKQIIQIDLTPNAAKALARRLLECSTRAFFAEYPP